MATYQKVVLNHQIIKRTFHISLEGVFKATEMLPDTNNLVESDPELPGHDAVEDEVDHAVDEGQHVHQFPQRGVAGDEKLVSKQPREKTKYGLKFRL